MAMVLHYEMDVLMLPGMVAAFIALAYVAFEKYRQMLQEKKPFQDLPMPPHSHWIFGHVKRLFDKDHFPHSMYSVVHDSANEDGHTGFWMLGKGAISVLTVEDARHVMLRESYRETIPIVTRYMTQIIGEKNILLLNNAEWKVHRGAVSGTFVPSFLQHSQKHVHQVAQDLTKTILQKIEDERTSSNQKIWQVDVQPIMKMVTMDVIGKSGFSTDFNCCQTLQPSPVVQAFEFLTADLSVRLQNPIFPWNLWPHLFPTERNRLQTKYRGILRGFVSELLTKANEERASNSNINGNHKHHNLLTRLVAAHETNKAGQLIGEGTHHSKQLDEDLIDVMCSLLFASYDTTSSTLMFALYLLSIHPDMQDNCVQEIQSLLKSGSDLSNAEELHYCGGIIKETLRLYPPAFIARRTLSKPLQLSGGYMAREGTNIIIPVWAMQRDEKLFPFANECRPERWVQRVRNSGAGTCKGLTWEERVYRKDTDTTNASAASDNEMSSNIPAANPEAFLAFSFGGRNCPGAKFALQEAVIVLANILKDVKVLPVPDFKLKLKLRALPYPEDGMPLRLAKRSAG